jgi:hypothetical protein
MSYTKRLTESDIKFGFIYISREFVKEVPRGMFTLVAGEESYTVQLDACMHLGHLSSVLKTVFSRNI